VACGPVYPTRVSVVGRSPVPLSGSGARPNLGREGRRAWAAELAAVPPGPTPEVDYQALPACPGSAGRRRVICQVIRVRRPQVSSPDCRRE
jgi:hypothetical protein